MDVTSRLQAGFHFEVTFSKLAQYGFLRDVTFAGQYETTCLVELLYQRLPSTCSNENRLRLPTCWTSTKCTYVCTSNLQAVISTRSSLRYIKVAANRSKTYFSKSVNLGWTVYGEGKESCGSSNNTGWPRSCQSPVDNVDVESRDEFG